MSATDSDRHDLSARHAHVLAATAVGEDESAVTDLATAVADVLHTQVRHICYRDVQEVLDVLAAPDTALAVLSADGAAVWQLLRRAAKPVILVPLGARPLPQTISRVLVPLNGNLESTAAVGETVGQLAQGGVELVVLHVFDQKTVPRFWDQTAYAQQAWEREFIARHCADPNTQLEVRTGVPDERVLDVASAAHVDLIALGWSQQLGTGRARTVRRTVRDAQVPVMLVPIPRQ